MILKTAEEFFLAKQQGKFKSIEISARSLRGDVSVSFDLAMEIYRGEAAAGRILSARYWLDRATGLNRNSNRQIIAVLQAAFLGILQSLDVDGAFDILARVEGQIDEDDIEARWLESQIRIAATGIGAAPKQFSECTHKSLPQLQKSARKNGFDRIADDLAYLIAEHGDDASTWQALIANANAHNNMALAGDAGIGLVDHLIKKDASDSAI